MATSGSMRGASSAADIVGWAWRSAGTPTIVIPRWSTDDATAAGMMKMMYEELVAPGRYAGGRGAGGREEDPDRRRDARPVLLGRLAGCWAVKMSSSRGRARRQSSRPIPVRKEVTPASHLDDVLRRADKWHRVEPGIERAADHALPAHRGRHGHDRDGGANPRQRSRHTPRQPRTRPACEMVGHRHSGRSLQSTCLSDPIKSRSSDLVSLSRAA